MTTLKINESAFKNGVLFLKSLVFDSVTSVYNERSAGGSDKRCFVISEQEAIEFENSDISKEIIYTNCPVS